MRCKDYKAFLVTRLGKQGGDTAVGWSVSALMPSCPWRAAADPQGPALWLPRPR